MRSRRFRLPALGFVVAALATVVLSACGEEIDVEAPEGSRLYRGAVIFEERCSGCHTFGKAGSEGSAFNVADRERVDGPNLNVRAETKEQVLYAIRNGGFSGALMPENIVVGEEAELVAEFVAEYAGYLGPRPDFPETGTGGPGGAGGPTPEQPGATQEGGAETGETTGGAETGQTGTATQEPGAGGGETSP